jgi:hypothetical protein
MEDFLTKVLPWIGAAASGNVPALISMAANTVSEAIGVEVKPTREAISSAVSAATPEQLVDMQVKDSEFKLKMQTLGFNHIEEMSRLALAETQTYAADTQQARDKFATNQSVFRLGAVILATFAISIGMAMWGAYLLLSGGITVKDVGMVAAVFSFLGTMVGYMAANAQQVVGYYYGSSKGSGDNREALSASIGQLGAALSKRQ